MNNENFPLFYDFNVYYNLIWLSLNQRSIYLNSLPKQSVLIEYGEGFYTDDNKNYVALPNCEHTIIISGLKPGLAFLEIDFNAYLGNYELDILPINIYRKIDNHKEWVNNFNARNDNFYVSIPAQKGDVYLLILDIDDYTTINARFNVNFRDNKMTTPVFYY